MAIHLDVGVASDVGDRRKENQDSVLVKTSFLNGNEIGMFVVADGMGGMKNGKDASYLVTESISYWWDYFFLEMAKNKEPISNIIASLDKTIELTNYQLCVNSEKSGTTLSLLLIFGDIYIIRNIGDSRIYVINKKITQLTKDHSFEEALNESGLVLREEFQFANRKNLITNCIGINKKLKIYEKIDKVYEEDVFLICSDGFYGEVTEPEIMKTIFNNRIFTMQDKTRKLRELIKLGDANDNVSLVLVKQIRN